MDIQFYGANALVITTKHARLVIDDNLADLGAKTVSKEGDIALFTGPHGTPASTPKIMIDQPGEYEVSGVMISGIAARSHIDEPKQHNATCYKIVTDDTRLLVVGHIYPELSESLLETIGTIDVMFVPVGGNGFTLDPVGALNVIKKVEPKLVIPTYFASERLQFPVPAQELEQALKVLSMEPKEKVAKFRVKPGELSDTTQLVVVTES